MKKYSDLEYLKLSKWNRFLYTLLCLIVGIPRGIWNGVKSIGKFFAKLGIRVKDEFVDIFLTFKNGDWKTRISYFVMGFGNIARGQVLRGLLFLLMEVVFIVYMAVAGVKWLSQLPELGVLGPVQEYNPIFDQYTTVYNDNSFKILLYGVLTIFFIVAFIVTWRMNISQNKIAQQILATGKKLKSGKDDLRSLVDDQFHKTLLALPTAGILFFTVLPTIYMIIIAFTNYDFNHDGYANLFSWVGLHNFNQLIDFSEGGMGLAFGEILGCTLIWAFFATFSNYFLGMFVALMINKKGIKLKKFWRTVLVMTIAIPQFVSLLYVSHLFDSSGIIGRLLDQIPSVHQFLDENNYISIWGDPLIARILVIVINIWIGIPHIMLMATGILMNIPADLYESSKIDGATGPQQFTKITLPYMLFVTGPYLLTSFVSNLNNFNVIYLLSGGGPDKGLAGGATAEQDFSDLGDCLD